MVARNRVEGCRTGPIGYLGWRNRFLGLDSWAPEKIKKTVSDFRLVKYTYIGELSIF